MKNVLRLNETVRSTRVPADWLKRRYHLPDATARLIAELTFAVGTKRASDAERGAR